LSHNVLPLVISLTSHTLCRSSCRLSSQCHNFFQSVVSVYRTASEGQESGSRVRTQSVWLSVGRRLLRGAGRASGSRKERARLVCGRRARILLDDAFPRIARTRLIPQLSIAQADLEERLGGLGAHRVDIDDLGEPRQCARVVTLAIVRFADPVLSVGREGVLRKALRQLGECEDGPLVLIRLKTRETRRVHLIGRGVGGKRQLSG